MTVEQIKEAALRGAAHATVAEARNRLIDTGIVEALTAFYVAETLIHGTQPGVIMAAVGDVVVGWCGWYSADLVRPEVSPDDLAAAWAEGATRAFRASFDAAKRSQD